MKECDHLPPGSRIRSICEGTAGLPLQQINAYRTRNLGLAALPEAKYRPALPGIVLAAPRPSRANGESLRAASPGSRVFIRETDDPEEILTGPGRELMLLWADKHVPPCDACNLLAQTMNRWGPDGCEVRIDDIVNDILPRAKAWVAENRPFVDALLPSGILEWQIRKQITADVRAAIEKARNNPTPLPSTPSPRKRTHGCTSCGKSKRRGSVHAPGDVSNLLLSTAWGPLQDELDRKFPAVQPLPFTSRPIVNLLYHIYPRKHSVWQWNLDQLLKRIGIFNGRRIIAIAVDGDTDTADDVRRYLGGHVHEYLVYQNSRKVGEMVSFLPLLRQLITDDPNQITFRAHAKGVRSHKNVPHLQDWTELLYRTNLDDMPHVLDQLSSHAMTGACRKFGQFVKRTRSVTYSGSFYWFRPCWVYSRKWEDVDNSKRWGCEAWPSLFTEYETACLFLDDTGNMYSEEYWHGTVLPQYQQWKRQKQVS